MDLAVRHLDFEDFQPGTVSEYGAYFVSREEIIAFAGAFDPQPFHLEDAAARASLFGGLAASGWHTCGIVMRINCDGFLVRSSSLGAPGIAEVKWLKPVRPGDTLRVRRTIVDARPSRSRPQTGIVDFLSEALNQADETVMTQRNVLMFRRRNPPEDGPEAAALRATRSETMEGRPVATKAGPVDPAVPPEPEAVEAGAPLTGLPFFEDALVGTRVEIGRHTFARDEILAFARDYDPQPFHVDEDAARRGPFGALAASGWHTAALWMKNYVDWRGRLAAAMAERSEPVPALGPSPGFRDLKWLRPVYVGDTITYATTLVDKRASTSRPQWGLIFNRNTGTNQHGVPVLEFTGAAFLARRGGR